jgi:hypothetical protein
MGADYLNPAACVELFAGATTGNSAFAWLFLVYTGGASAPLFFTYW